MKRQKTIHIAFQMTLLKEQLTSRVNHIINHNCYLSFDISNQIHDLKKGDILIVDSTTKTINLHSEMKNININIIVVNKPRQHCDHGAFYQQLLKEHQITS